MFKVTEHTAEDQSSGLSRSFLEKIIVYQINLCHLKIKHIQ